MAKCAYGEVGDNPLAVLLARKEALDDIDGLVQGVRAELRRLRANVPDLPVRRLWRVRRLLAAIFHSLVTSNDRSEGKE